MFALLLDTEVFKHTLFRVSAYLISQKEFDRQLLHHICWAPIKHFTEKSMDAAVACWDWVLAARSEHALQVTCFHMIVSIGFRPEFASYRVGSVSNQKIELIV